MDATRPSHDSAIDAAPKSRERVALQTHVPLPRNFGERVVLQLLREGYSGQAPVGDGLLNLCLVSRPNDLAAIKRWAENAFAIPVDHPWRTIAPLARASLPAAASGLFLVGDAARVVEPFTGEGIYYALRSGELAAEAIARQDPPHYIARAPGSLRRTTLGQLAGAGRGAASTPNDESLRILPNESEILQRLTRKVVPL